LFSAFTYITINFAKLLEKLKKFFYNFILFDENAPFCYHCYIYKAKFGWKNFKKRPKFRAKSFVSLKKPACALKCFDFTKEFLYNSKGIQN